VFSGMSSLHGSQLGFSQILGRPILDSLSSAHRMHDFKKVPGKNSNHFFASEVDIKHRISSII